MMVRNSQIRGFVLLWTLALLVLAAVVLSGVTRRSARAATRAIDAREQLQAKWAMESCCQVILPAAEAILRRAERQRGQVQASAQLEEWLGGVHLQIEVADEQAKVNLNSVYRQIGPQRAASVVRLLTGSDQRLPAVLLNADPRAPHPEDASEFGSEPAPVAAAPAELVPSVGRPAAAHAVRPFGCWSQVFDLQELPPEGAPCWPAQLTCWGDGRLNLRRASAEAAKAFLSLDVPETSVYRLLQSRDQLPAESAATWIKAARLSSEQAKLVADRVADDSACHSVRMLAQCGTYRWREVAILVRDASVPAEAGASTMQAAQAEELSRSQAAGRVYRLAW